MKKLVKSILALSLLVGLNSCTDEKDLKVVTPQNTTNFKIITPSTGDGIVLGVTTPTNPGINLTWTAADYSSPTAITYTPQIAPNGTAANSTSWTDLGSTTNKFIAIQSADLNLKSLLAGAVPFVNSAVEIRIKATVGTTGNQPSYTNKISYLVTPYGCLNQYAIGQGLTQADWTWNNPRTLSCNDGVLTMTSTFANGTADTFRFFTVNGDYGSGRNYPWYITNGYKIVSSLVNANDGDQNFRNTGTPGSYFVTIDSNNKTINTAKRTVTTGFEPNSQWLVGAATPGGWSWAGNNETELGVVNMGIYEVAIKLNSTEIGRAHV